MLNHTQVRTWELRICKSVQYLHNVSGKFNRHCEKIRLGVECVDPRQSVPRKWSRLVVVPQPSEKNEKVVAERDTVLTETVQRKTVPVLDPSTGDLTVQTTETIERIIEREVTNPTGANAAHISLGEGRGVRSLIFFPM